jgi:cobalamin biosynthesis protein CobT
MTSNAQYVIAHNALQDTKALILRLTQKVAWAERDAQQANRILDGVKTWATSSQWAGDANAKKTVAQARRNFTTKAKKLAALKDELKAAQAALEAAYAALDASTDYAPGAAASAAASAVAKDDAHEDDQEDNQEDAHEDDHEDNQEDAQEDAHEDAHEDNQEDDHEDNPVSYTHLRAHET